MVIITKPAKLTEKIVPEQRYQKEICNPNQLKLLL